MIEFKLDQSATIALEQIKEKKYYEKYLTEERPVFIVGINFSSEMKSVENWLMEEVA